MRRRNKAYFNITGEESGKREMGKLEEYLYKIGLNIAYYRKANRMTQEDLSNRSGISRNHLQRIENGACASMETMINISKALDIPLFELFQFRS